jgi:hypothetical protein
MFKKIVMLLSMVILLGGCSDRSFDVVCDGQVVSMKSVESSKTDVSLVLYKIKKINYTNYASFIGEGILCTKHHTTLYAPKGFAEMGDILGYTNGVYGVIDHE